MCFGPLVAEQVNVVSNLQQARVLFYDYYDTGNNNTCFHGSRGNTSMSQQKSPYPSVWTNRGGSRIPRRGVGANPKKKLHEIEKFLDRREENLNQIKHLTLESHPKFSLERQDVKTMGFFCISDSNGYRMYLPPELKGNGLPGTSGTHSAASAVAATTTTLIVLIITHAAAVVL